MYKIFIKLVGKIAGSQGPDLNRSGIALQAIAWPLRHLGTFVYPWPHLRPVGSWNFILYFMPYKDWHCGNRPAKPHN
jgi:hypothetical protein